MLTFSSDLWPLGDCDLMRLPAGQRQHIEPRLTHTDHTKQSAVPLQEGSSYTNKHLCLHLTTEFINLLKPINVSDLHPTTTSLRNQTVAVGAETPKAEVLQLIHAQPWWQWRQDWILWLWSGADSMARSLRGSVFIQTPAVILCGIYQRGLCDVWCMMPL